MSMVFCRGCAKELHETAQVCPQCGAPQGASQAAIINAAANFPMLLQNKFHIVLICAASLAVLLLFTTRIFGLIGLATGVSFGMSVRLFISHQKAGFQGASKLSWIVILLCTTAAMGCMFFQAYRAQVMLLIVVSVRSLMLYFVSEQKV